MAGKAAALSFYTAFSLAPIVVLLMLLFGFIVDTKLLQAELIEQATGLLGEDGGRLIEGMLRRATDPNASLSAMLAFAAAVFGATTAFAQLKDSLDEVLGQPEREDSSFRDTLRARLLSFGIVASLGFLLLVSLLASAMLNALSGVLTRWFAVEAVWIGQIVSTGVTFLGTFLLVFIIYRMLPARRLTRRGLVTGAVASTLLFALGKIAIGIYLGHTDSVSAFGAAGSLAVVLIWVYYSALAFFTGALIARYIEEPRRLATAVRPVTP